MSPKHDEVVKHHEDGWAVAWDATKVDPRKVSQVHRVAREQAKQLDRILNGEPAMAGAESPTTDQ